jgi:hypothetical protein
VGKLLVHLFFEDAVIVGEFGFVLLTLDEGFEALYALPVR